MNDDKLSSNHEAIRQRLDAACKAAGRNPAEVTILPVTKFHPAEAVLTAARHGFTAVGENRVAELAEKKAACTPILEEEGLALRWELIGHLQSNKARLAVANADRIQSVDSVKLLYKLDQLCLEMGRERLPILLQINAGSDPAKHGADLSDAPELLDAALSLPRLQVDGLMTIAPLHEDPAEATQAAQECFINLRNLRDSLQATHKISLPVLSMGMTSDLEAAIHAGSTMIRIGTALFGEREY